MFSLPMTFKALQSFARDEAGVIAVDFVVLTGIATAAGIATMAAYNAELGFVNENLANGTQQHRDTRPSWAYRAHDPVVFQRYTTAVSQLSSDNLATLNAWANSTREIRDQITDPEAIQFFEDFDNAITKAYANRDQSRDVDQTEYRDYDLARVSNMLGFRAPTDPNADTSG